MLTVVIHMWVGIYAVDMSLVEGIMTLPVCDTGSWLTSVNGCKLSSHQANKWSVEIKVTFSFSILFSSFYRFFFFG